MKATAKRFLNSKPCPEHSRRIKTQHLKLNAPSTRPQRPIIYYSFSLSLIAINTHQNLITIDKSITYVTLRPFTSVKNVRQIRPFMQNKPKVNMDKIGKIKPIHVFARKRNLTMTVYDFTRGYLPPYKGV